MAQEPSGSNGQPSEYGYGHQWQQPGQDASAESGIPGGYAVQGTGQDGWGDPAQTGQAAYYGGYDQQQQYPQQQYDQQYSQAYYGNQPYGDQPYGDQPYSDQSYGNQSYGNQGYGEQAYGGQPYPDQAHAGQYAGYPYADPTGGQQPQVPPQGYPDQQQYETQAYQAGHQQQPPAADDDATQQWQPLDAAAVLGAGAPPADPALGDPSEEDPAEGGPGLVDRVRAALGGDSDGPGRRTLLTRLAIGGAALVVLVGAGIYVAGSGGSGGGDTGTGAGTASSGFSVDHTKAWAAQPAAAGADDGLLGSWLVPKAVVRGDGTGVHAYDLTTGKQVWTAQTPKPGAVPCGMSPTVSGGVGAVLFAPQAGSHSCTLLSAVDTGTGKQKWTTTLAGTKGSYSARAMVNDGRVIAIGDSKAVGYDLATGKSKWENKGRGKFCTLSGAGSGNTVLVHSSCADSSPKEQIVALDAASGRLVWWRGLGTPKTVTVLSAEPAVVLTTGSTEADDRIRSWDTKGNPGPEIPVTQATGRLDVEHGMLDATPTVFFSGTTMATALVPAGGGTPDHASLTAVDLKSGKTTWTAAAQEKGKAQPVGLDGDALVVATEERTDQSAHLSRFALADGKETAGGGFPKDTGSVLTAGRVLTSDGLVVAVPTFTSTYVTSASAYRAGK